MSKNSVHPAIPFEFSRPMNSGENVDSQIPFNRNFAPNSNRNKANSNANGNNKVPSSRKTSQNSAGSANKKKLPLGSRQSSTEDQQNDGRKTSRKHKLHPAERRAVILANNPPSGDGYKFC